MTSPGNAVKDFQLHPNSLREVITLAREEIILWLERQRDILPEEDYLKLLCAWKEKTKESG